MCDDVIVIGAGQSGLATAYALKQAGLRFRVLEASEGAAGSWPTYYDSLRLFSTARYSSLPGMVFPGDPERYPTRGEVISYLEAYANQFRFPVHFNTRVEAVQKKHGYFHIRSTQGEIFHAKAVIVASGSFNQPNRPALAGIEQFTGKILHSSEYQRPSDVQGEKIAIVGAGNSAVQIAYELSRDHDVTLISKVPPTFAQQRPLGKDVHFWLRAAGLDTLPLGRWFNIRLREPVLDTGIYRAAFKQGRIKRLPMFDRVTADGLAWGDRHQSVNTLLLATGFVQRPPYLEGLQGLSAQDAAVQRGGISVQVPGLYFVGISWQRSHASATLRGVGADAKYVVAHLQGYVKNVAVSGVESVASRA